MDVEGRRAFWSAIRQDAAKGRTVLFATHYLEEADQYADRIVLISNGRIVADGTGSEVKALAAGRTVRATLPGADADRIGRIAGVDGARGARRHGPRARHATPTPSPATCSPRPTPATWRSPPAASRRPSSP